jgi:uncharacterized coiled-coil protein SlyX
LEEKMEIKDLISQIEAKIQGLNRQVQEEWAEMEMLQIEERCRELSNELTRLQLEYPEADSR